MAKKPGSEISIGKFDILATFTYAKALLDGHSDDDAKQRGIVAAIMGAQARLGTHHHLETDFEGLKDAAEKKKKSTITAGSFDHQVKAKLGDFFDDVFLPAMEAFVEAGLSYDDVKHIVKIPTTWGAKISGEEFKKRTAAVIRKHRARPRKGS